jgi:uncharacterized protein
MPVTVNLRHLEKKDQHLEGDLPVKELDLMVEDEMIHPKEPLKYDLDVSRSGTNLLVNGRVELPLDCECVRCLKPLKVDIELDPYETVVPLEGEEKAQVDNDLVDLTPYLREDILLAFPRHPVCEAGCDPLPQVSTNIEQSGASARADTQSAWDELNKLKF